MPYPAWLVQLRSHLKAYWSLTAHLESPDPRRSEGVKDVMASNAKAMQPDALYDLSLLSGPLADLMNNYDTPTVTSAHRLALCEILGMLEGRASH